MKDGVLAMIEKWDELNKKHDEALEVAEAAMAKTDHTRWYKRTEWTVHLAKCNLRHLGRASRLPDRDETTLKRAVELNTILTAKCVDGLSTLDRETRRWLRSAKQSELDQRPLARLQNESSQDRYTSYTSRMICYMLRVEESMRTTAQKGRGSDEAEEHNARSDEDRWSALNAEEHDGNDETSDNERADETESDEDRTDEPIDVLRDARRLFPWHDELKERVAKLRQIIENPCDEAVQLQTLLCLHRTLIFQRVRGDVHRSAIMHFLAVLGIDEETYRLRTGNNFSFILAGMVYCLRVLAVEILMPSEQRQRQTAADDRRFLKQRAEWLADGSYSVMSKMISLLAYGKKLALSHTNKGTTLFNEDGTILHYNGEQIELSQFCEMAQSAVGDAEDILWKDLMWTKNHERFEISLSELKDNLEASKRGESFIGNKQNGLQDKREWILKRAMALDKGRMCGKSGEWLMRQVRKYLRTVSRFKELLLFCVHVTSGQPARGTEVTSIRHRNGYLQDRNIYVLFGLLMTVTRYHKSQSQWDNPKVVPRFVPWRVGQLLTVYLSYVRPLEDFLRSSVQGEGWTDYVWANEQGGPWETDRLTRIIARESQKRLGVRLTTHDYRHVAIAIGRKVIGERFVRGGIEDAEQVEEPEVDEETDALEMSAGRGAEVGVRRYGVRIDMVKHLSAQTIDTFRPLSEAWHEGFLGLVSYDPHRRKRRLNARSVGSVEELERNERERKMAMMLSNNGIGGWHTALQSMGAGGNTATVAFSPTTISSSRDSSDSRSRSHSRHNRFARGSATPRLIQQAWHPDQDMQQIRTARAVTLQTPSSQTPGTAWLNSSPLESRSRAASSDVRIASRAIRQVVRVGETEIKKAVQKALGSTEVRYRSDEQRQALIDIVVEEQQTPLVVILPTGGGKSLLFLAPACLEDARMTIVVVPFRQLINNMVERAKKCGIDCMEWTEGISDPTTLVFVSADKVQSGFLLYAQKQCSSGYVRRIFVDECHVTFTQSDWRPKLSRLNVVRGLRVPLVLLTATLPCILEIELEYNMLLQVARYIRAPTARPKTQYTVVKVEYGKLHEEVVALCIRKKAQLEVGEKGVVYSKSRNGCELLARELRCAYYHAGLVDDEERLQKWLSEGGLLVATSALGTGVDFPGIMFTVHVDVPYGMIDFSQESGRAGRAGEDVDSIIVVEKGKAERMMDGTRGADDGVMYEFIATAGCRRLVMSRYFDGREDGCGEGYARCDGCGEGITSLERRSRRAAIDRQLVEDTLGEIVQDGCVMCFVASTDGTTTGG